MTSIEAQPESSLNVAVIGGSITGCAVAIELQRRGHSVTVLERSGEELKDRGAGIGIPASVLDTLKQRDLVDADIAFFPATTFSRLCRTDDEAHYGYVAWEQPADIVALNWGSLYRNLRRRVPNECYRTHARVTRLDNDMPDRVVVELADGETLKFDLVVCADGYASTGRATLFPHIQTPYAGYVLWRGAMHESELGDTAPLESGIQCVGFPGGHGIFYFVPGPEESVGAGERLVNWGIYHQLSASELSAFLTDANGYQHEGSLPPGSMPEMTERRLKAAHRAHLPDYYADIADRCKDTFAYVICDCEVPAYHAGRICLAGDAGAFARPHSGAGALKGMNDAISLGEALAKEGALFSELSEWSEERAHANNQLVKFGNQLGDALVINIPDWSQMNEEEMKVWFSQAVTIASTYIDSGSRT